MSTLNMLQLCKLGTCHHKSVTQYVQTMKHSLLYKSPPSTPSTS